MKKVLFFISLSFFSLNLIAQTSNLTIFSEEGTPFYLVLNGVRQNESPETNIRVNGLYNSYYNAKIIFSNKSIPSIEKKYMTVVDSDEMNGEVTYKISKNRKGKLKLNIFSFTPANQVLPPPNYVRVVEYNMIPMPEITYTETTTTTTVGNPRENVDVQINMGGIGIDANINISDSDGYSTSTTTTTTTTTTSGYPINNSTVIIDDGSCYPMDNAMFSNALYSINSKDFSGTQLTLAKQIVSSNCLTALQIKEIARIFDFEDTKLQFAKFAYIYCWDPENYWQINDVFDFESTIEELNQYILRR